MKEALELLVKTKIVPVIQIDNIVDAIPLAETLIENGLPIAEVTLRSPVAMEAIQVIRSRFPEMLLIAGTVTNPELADQAVEAGATIVVSPGFNPETVRHCVSRGINIIPGVATPGEMEQAINFGLTTLKFFPAEANGGVQTLKAVSGPYSQLTFMPTGGITASNISDYLALPSVACCGGSWMVDKKLVAEHKWEELAVLIREAIDLVQN
ncbi:bifunctional 4-hydroxy-2-oxoglutarate aldolase/2-dehydro-3-deoxy-phosphogluconate aldolase [Vibrio cyclitrophicus]|uniref:bifunctional 4-hydroxy-2-oxoglutarate aldolase/2-dehydro-3-deoxy-phosphogluconate aldolase n=1 Tax=Vibrio TaxID=662 RepID=UPI000C82C8BE|nr:bifunctional 4-hydroxy-2-oxoglutarate aldolase/2-dehydro-3-deoxy-phosphogluconate aldolase [Vibrio cyclitrophicus]KAA8597645.1 4-hydroxy-2-oxoglutarate aldolase 2-dehydro-3-deoxyphosphogluconate aldolase [Vibrio cyclitrophicus]PMH40923.1 2-dehydro-3-deoxyphosphogluconate aldolase [Vibrio cyclitrophicus]PMH77510.1 2-dehydro-3-deoxyphosphogluconate aldolase [Vibrio cyclitrophicus]